MSFQYSPLSGEGAVPPAPNRRVTVRYQCAPATPGRVRLTPKQEMQHAWVLNLSVTGVGLLLTRPLPPETTLVVRLHGATDGKPHELAARVAHSTREPGGEWVVGCRLVTPLTRDELDALL